MSEIDHAAIYEGVRLRVTSLVASLQGETLDGVAPATPEWRLRDIVAHLAGNTADIVSGNLGDVGSDAWTKAQVDARSDAAIGEILDEWSRSCGLVEPLIASFDPVMRAMFLIDAVTHEHDLRGALGQRGERTSAAIVYAFDIVAQRIGAQHGEAGALRIIHEAGDTIVGSGEPTATVRTSRFEIVRASTGRRSTAQVVAWDWKGDPRPDTAVLPRFSPPRATPLHE